METNQNQIHIIEDNLVIAREEWGWWGWEKRLKGYDGG